MHEKSRTLVVLAIISCFLNPLNTESRVGAIGLVAASLAVCIPVLIRKTAKAVLFTPHLEITLDPLQPEAKVLAQGIKRALSKALVEQTCVRVLVSQVPNHRVVLDLNAVRRQCHVLVYHDAQSADPISKSQAKIEPFATGSSPAEYTIAADDGNLLLVVSPDDARGLMVKLYQPSRWWSVLACGSVFTLAWIYVGGFTAWLGVLPASFLGLWFEARRAHVRRSCFGCCLAVGSSCCIVYNLIRFAMI